MSGDGGGADLGPPPASESHDEYVQRIGSERYSVAEEFCDRVRAVNRSIQKAASLGLSYELRIRKNETGRVTGIGVTVFGEALAAEILPVE